MMMIRDIHRTIFSAVALLLLNFAGFAQNIKTGVLVIGASPSGLAAAIQAAHSGAKAVLLDKGNFESVDLPASEAEMRSGVYAAFIRRVEGAQRYPVTKNQTFTPSFAATIFKAWTDTVKNLQVVTKATITSIKKNGKGWEAVLSDRRGLKADVIIDATTDGYISRLIPVSKTPAGSVDTIPYQSKKYRTGIGLIPPGKFVPATLPVSELLSGTENFIVTGGSIIPPSMSTGQAAGAVGAYCSFFKTTTGKLNVRTIQSELINFGSHLLAFDDIDRRDSNLTAIQSIGLTGILKGKKVDGKFLFRPDSSVSSHEIMAPVKEYYLRSQIWFPDNIKEKLTVDDVLSLIKCVASRGKELNKEVEKAWTPGLKLPGKFDLKRTVTRREFAVLFNSYVKPFIVAVDLDGALKR
ncbi:FAD-dependent oxidoreductase [Pararcticibacter amylolyticus]|uniref:FAD-dependent oxidoreductase n=1 Tax=Pararcticibacter amylolyticus TaxID=2173175 RepID=A0A2U2PMF8_9SPHI|nr:FAD-dependent oxidoreductase [Pararcticibacter amylolyticus]PWG82508.1 hypothetical protein DDR33_01175 [Pararcticibacter amylolyticus]